MKISILSPVWNEEAGIDAMVESVIHQPYEDWEIIFVDDGSTDGTPDVLTKWARRDSRVRSVIPGRKLGKVAAFNLAFENASGDLVCHLAGDDTLAPEGLTARVRRLEDHVDNRVVAFFKLRINDKAGTSEPLIVPRGEYGSRSGPSITLTRPLAREVFPVPERLPSEDLWMGGVAAGLADVVVHDTTVVTEYSIHMGNSNPRRKTFAEMNEAIHQRMAYAELAIEYYGSQLNSETVRHLRTESLLEERRYAGNVLGVLRVDAPWIDRLANAAMAHPFLWRVRQRGQRFFSGRRAR